MMTCDHVTFLSICDQVGKRRTHETLCIVEHRLLKMCFISNLFYCLHIANCVFINNGMRIIESC